METESIKVEVRARTETQHPSLRGICNVLVTLRRIVEEFIVDESDGGTITSLRSHRDSSFNDDPIILFNFQNFTPSHVYKHCQGKFHDQALSKLVTDRIVVESRGRDLPQRPLSMTVFVTVTRKEYIVVPCNSSPSTMTTRTTGSDQESDQSCCAICLENMSDSENYKPICELPRCVHKFHLGCFLKWRCHRHKSCPLCRKPI